MVGEEEQSDSDGESKQAQSGIDKKLDILIANQAKLLKANQTTNEKIMEFQKTIINMQKELANKDLMIKELRDELNEFQQLNRSNMFEIHNLEERISENKEDLESSIIKVAATVGVNIESSDIEVVHRIPTRSKTACKPILVQLASRKKRNELLETQRKNHQEKKKIVQNDVYGDNKTNTVYVNESLTKFNKELLYEAKRLKIQLGLYAVYSVGGRIFVKEEEYSRPVRVKNLADVEAFSTGD